MDLLKLSSYDYSLPKELIAQTAHSPADECKLLYLNKKGEIKDLIFKDIEKLLGENDILFFNNSKVVKARIQADKKINFIINKNGQEKECINCEILFLKKIDKNLFEALVRPGKKLKPGTKIKIKADKEYFFEILDYTKEGRVVKYLGEENIFDVLENIGQMPLPPYIKYSKDKEKPYQPVQAKKEGSVAAPTASLHFTQNLLNNLKNNGVDFLESTLHIGMGTFKTVDVEDISNYDIHSETVEIPLDIFQNIGENKKDGKNIIAVGTTATRILESLPYLYKKIQILNLDVYKKIENKYFDNLVKNLNLREVDKFIDRNIVVGQNNISFDTKLYIYPGFKYKLVDKLITNFHLPKSSLLMLVAAFIGYENMMKAYQYAIDNKYRFFSFGDAMFLENK